MHLHLFLKDWQSGKIQKLEHQSVQNDSEVT